MVHITLSWLGTEVYSYSFNKITSSSYIYFYGCLLFMVTDTDFPLVVGNVIFTL